MMLERVPASLRNLIAIGAVTTSLVSGPALAQDNPVYVDDSPRAWELFRRAVDQVQDNTGEAVRLFQELLDESALKLIPVSEAATDHFSSVRQRVNTALRDDDALLERYQNIEEAVAARLLREGDLERLAITRSLTEPGLEATLRLAQDAIEDARFLAAAGWLGEARDHPAITEEQAAHGAFMTATVAHYLDDAASLQEAMARLADLGERGRTLADHVRDSIAGGRGPARRAGTNSLDQPPTTDLTDLVAEEIWAVPLTDSLLARRHNTPLPTEPLRANPIREQVRRAGDLMTTTVTVAGSTVYANQGHTVLALDRFTGRERWTFSDAHRRTVANRDSDRALDMNFITVLEDNVVTLTGHASADDRFSQGRVLCLDARTGTPRWTRSLDRIGGNDELEGLFPHGEPIIAEGTVYLLARKVTPQLLSSCYVVALDVRDGTLRWARHIASSGGLRQSTRQLSTPLYHRGDLYVATAVGAVARLHANTGQIRWLRRYHVPISTSFQDQSRKPWEMSTPVITADRVLAIHSDQRRVVVLDRDTGHQLEAHTVESGEGWARPRYLLSNGRAVYAIGQEIRCFDVNDLEHPIWQLPGPAQSGERSRDRAADRLELRGRVQLVPGALIVPTLDGVLVVNDESGATEHRLVINSVGNPLAIDAQLILAGSDELNAFMSFRRAEEMLRQRIAQDANDPEPALSLLRLGARAHRLDLALEAATLALDAIDHDAVGVESQEARQELFDLLLEIDQEQVARTEDEGLALHAMIGGVAIEPAQQVEYRLAFGRWLRRRSVAQAIEQYQAILSDPRLAVVRRSEDGSIRTARAWAGHRIGGLIAQQGAAVYAPQADFAAVRLERLLGSDQADPEALLDLAAEFPHTDTALTATVEAARRRRQQGDLFGALAALMNTYHRTPSPIATQHLLGRAAEVCEEAGLQTAATTLLMHAQDQVGNEPLQLEQRTHIAADWLEGIDAAALRPQAPRLGALDGMGEELAGRLVPSHPGLNVAAPTDHILLFDGIEMRLVRGDALEEQWSYALEDPAPQVLHRDPDRVVLWFGTDPDDPRAVMLSARNGTELWSTPPVTEILRDPVRDLVQERGVREPMPNGEPFNPKDTLPLVDDGRLILVRRSGGIVAFDIDDATTARWSMPAQMEKIHLARLHGFGLVIAGMQRQPDALGGAELVPRLLVLDPQTGRVKHRLRPIGRSGVRWMEVGPLGTLVYATAEGVEAIDLLSGQSRWASIVHEATETQDGWRAGRDLIIQDRQGDLRALALQDGGLSEPFGLPTLGEWDPMELQEVLTRDGQVYVRYRQRVIHFDPQGSVLGADIITDKRDYGWLLPTRDGLLLVSRFNTEQTPLVDRAGRRTQHTYRLYWLTDDCMVVDEAELPPINHRLYEATAVDGWLMLSTQADTLAIPMP